MDTNLDTNSKRIYSNIRNKILVDTGDFLFIKKTSNSVINVTIENKKIRNNFQWNGVTINRINSEEEYFTKEEIENLKLENRSLKIEVENLRKQIIDSKKKKILKIVTEMKNAWNNKDHVMIPDDDHILDEKGTINYRLAGELITNYVNGK